MHQAKLNINVPFFDVDAMHVVWHGHYVKYIEMTRSELLRLFDYDYPTMRANGHIWPIVDLRLKYVASAIYGQEIEVTATLVEWEHRLRIDYIIRCCVTRKVLTKATSIQVAVDIKTQEMLFESPDILLKKLGVERCT
ncbi:thioesterase [Pseudidiomarina salinarum]|uniref:Thioesterase n=1 Tax=Pseudidiomarina salinarum TaxID=435908 RepID=A0A094L7W8_9GAMM|nr:acyl-CoA thioesterase [Pseudidiomarina salinarum]KFZ30853.1 thioesterase [Pseudidiomarina salinarum]RUO71327.1 acyl-CoA thioesterase [Pseudidiomarina salinarum]